MSKQSAPISLAYDKFGPTPRWPTPKWRSCARGWEAECSAPTDIAGVEALLRQMAVCEFLADEPVIYRQALPYGHFAVGGARKRIVLRGVLNPEHGSGFRSTLRAHLLSLVNVHDEVLAAYQSDVDAGEPEASSGSGALIASGRAARAAWLVQQCAIQRPEAFCALEGFIERYAERKGIDLP